MPLVGREVSTANAGAVGALAVVVPTTVRVGGTGPMQALVGAGAAKATAAAVEMERMKTISDALERASARWKVASHGNSYYRIARKLLHGHLRMRLAAVNQVWVDDLYARLPKKASTANRHLAVLSAVLAAGGADTRRTIILRKIPEIANPRRSFSREELTAIDVWMRANATDHNKAMYAILRETGCRAVGEARYIDFERDIDWINKLVTLTSRKGGVGLVTRKVPLTLIAANAFSWAAQYGNRLRTSDVTFRRQWDTMRDSLFPGDRGAVPYALRHTYAYRLLAKDVPLHVVSRMMGHTSIETTMRYTHVNPADTESVRDALSSL